jgi:hypothetical protein
VPVHKTLCAIGERLVGVEGPVDDFAGNVRRNVPGPTLVRVEGDNPQCVLVLAGDEAPDDGLAVGSGEVGFEVGAAIRAEV